MIELHMFVLDHSLFRRVTSNIKKLEYCIIKKNPKERNRRNNNCWSTGFPSASGVRYETGNIARVDAYTDESKTIPSHHIANEPYIGRGHLGTENNPFDWRQHFPRLALIISCALYF